MKPKALLFATLLFFCFAYGAEKPWPGLSSSFSPEQLQSAEKLATKSSPNDNREKLERNYQQKIQRQVFEDLSKLYDPKNAHLLSISYASFTADETSGGGEDRGFGLHVVKRLILPLEDGTTKTIYVNEHWPQDSRTGGLFAPDEIRVQTQVRPGDAYQSGSYEQYLFDSFRLAWGPDRSQVEIVRQTIYEWNAKEKKNHTLDRRVPISAPFSCLECHDASNSFGDIYLQPGERKNFAAIVQDSHFTLPPEETMGFREYLSNLKSRKLSPTKLDKVKALLKDKAVATAVPGFLETLRSAMHSSSSAWLSVDSQLDAERANEWRGRQGVYQGSHGRYFYDALEEIVEGKYRWWEPAILIPVP